MSFSCTAAVSWCLSPLTQHHRCSWWQPNNCPHCYYLVFVINNAKVQQHFPSLLQPLIRKTLPRLLCAHVGLPSSHSPLLALSLSSLSQSLPNFFPILGLQLLKQTLLSESSHLHFKHDWLAPSPPFIFATSSSNTPYHSPVPPHLQKWRTAIYRSITGVSNILLQKQIIIKLSTWSSIPVLQTAELTFHHPTKKPLLLFHPRRGTAASLRLQSLPAQARGNKMLSPAPGSDGCESVHAFLGLPPPPPPPPRFPLHIAEFSWCVHVHSESSVPPPTPLRTLKNQYPLLENMHCVFKRKYCLVS